MYVNANTSHSESITGIIERITFHSPDNGFCVLRVKVKGRNDLVTVVGNAAVIHAGEYIEASGSWFNDKTHGIQFKAQSLKTVPPASLDGIIKYLGSGLIKGIGPHFAKKLADAFGADVLTVIENEPERLQELTGIGKKRCQKIIASWKDQKAIRDIMVFLQSHGIGTARAVRIYKTYGANAIDMVRENPYRLALDIHGIGFKTADELAQKLSIDPHSILRARAGVQHALQEYCSNGHCVIESANLVKLSCELLNVPDLIIVRAIEEGINNEELVAVFLNQQDCLALTSLYRAELGIAERIKRLLQFKPAKWEACDISKAIPWVEQQTGLKLSATQQQAVSAAIRSKVMVLTGGPGVGKTTVINSILKIINQYDATITLCAPTGRAAKRLSESTGLTAKTIHRLLEVNPKTMRFNYDQHNPLKTDYLVIDEASMIDAALMYNLIKALPDHACLLIVGDVDQLPSVGSGAVLNDIIASKQVLTVTLTEIFRQAASSKIIVNAHRINQGLMPIQDNDHTDFFFIAADTPEEVHDKLIYLAAERVPQVFSMHPLNDVQVLTPMQRGSLGARSLNTDLQQALNKQNLQSTAKVQRFGTTFAKGDKVMQTMNNYDKEVFNGDIGRIHQVDLEEGMLQINYEERLVDYDFDELDEVSLAYAVTIHKSQGSEYPAIILPVSMQHYVMLQRNLIYTGVTRGKRLVVLVGQKKALAVAVKNQHNTQRLTCLESHLSLSTRKIKI